MRKAHPSWVGLFDKTVPSLMRSPREGPFFLHTS